MCTKIRGISLVLYILSATLLFIYTFRVCYIIPEALFFPFIA